MEVAYDVVVLGGGPAGLSAGLYAARSGYSTLIVEKGFPGGRIVNSSFVENYPAMPEGISGMELGGRMHRQAEKAGAETVMVEALSVVPGREGGKHIVKASEGDVDALAVIVATGMEHRLLAVPGEAEFTGRGVSYCATCDGPFYKGRRVAVVGGGDSALTEALELAKFADEVSVIHRRGELRASKALQDKAKKNPKIKFVLDTVVDRIEGDPGVKDMQLKNVKNNSETRMDIDGVFVACGSTPATEFLGGVLPLDENGYVMTDEHMHTSIPGIFTAGDVRHGSARQVITAAGDGATAALSARRYIDSL